MVDLAEAAVLAPATVLMMAIRERAALLEEEATANAVAEVAELSEAPSSMTAERW
jgi:hypothetical protein